MLVATERSANGSTDGPGLRNRIDRFLREAQVPAVDWLDRGAVRAWAPPVDLMETDEEYLLHIDLPGVSPDRTDLCLDGNVLTVRGERHAGQGANEVRYHRQERPFGQFMRSFTLPTAVDRDAIAASYDAGVLTVRVPKLEDARPRRIAIGIPHTESND